MRVRGVATTDSFFRFKHLVFLRTHWCVSDVICIVTHTSPLKTNSHVSRFELSFLHTKSSNADRCKVLGCHGQLTAIFIYKKQQYSPGHTHMHKHTHARTHTHTHTKPNRLYSLTLHPPTCGMRVAGQRGRYDDSQPIGGAAN